MVKERISLTLDSEVVEKLDRKLEDEGVENRSQGVERFLEDYLKQESVSTAVVLGGGRDSSCLIPLNGKPVIDHTLDLLEEAGADKIVVNTADPEVREHLKGEDIEVFFEDEPLGTAGSLRELEDDIEDSFLVMNGDVLCEVDIEDMLQAHRDGEGIATVALTTVKDASPYGVIRMKGDRIVGFQEKPEEAASHLVNAGAYLLDPEFLKRIPSKEEKREVDIETLFETLANEGRLNGYVYEGEWREVG
ncbi:MAG: sugar phosphate nucleotidyltransferase [Candidatus Nanohaloarchaeota archaeon QJJ-7]|nr:sugar phosphate nucleotidyltransferase [Candidatus Nanohaloarchaeota archaeon QJJ-7]